MDYRFWIVNDYSFKYKSPTVKAVGDFFLGNIFWTRHIFYFLNSDFQILNQLHNDPLIQTLLH